MPLQNQPFMQPMDDSGRPYPGALAKYYLTGTTVPEDVYTDATYETAHAWPVEADAGGRFPDIYTKPNVTYRLVLQTALGAAIEDIDPISGGAAIGEDDLEDEAVTEAKLADNSVSSRTIAGGAVTNAKLADMPDLRVKGNVSGETAAPADLTMAQLYDKLIRPAIRGTYVPAAYGAVDDTYKLVCDGRSLLIADHPDLSALIRPVFGGADGTHFTLPDLRARNIVGVVGASGRADGLTIGQSHDDQLQGFKIVVPIRGDNAALEGIISGGTGDTDHGAITALPANDGTNGVPRTGLTTHGRELAAVMMIYR